MTALQDEFYAKHPYLKDKKLFANLSDRVINEVNAFEVDMDNYIADDTKKNSTNPDYEPITNKQRFLLFMQILSEASEGDIKYANRTISTKNFVESLYNVKRLDGEFFCSSLEDKEYTRADVKELIERAGKLDEELAKYGESYLEEEPAHPNPMSAGVYEAYETSIDIYEGFVKFMESKSRGVNDPVIAVEHGSTHKTSEKADAENTSKPSMSLAIPEKKTMVTNDTSLDTLGTEERVTYKLPDGTITGSGATSKAGSRKIEESPFEKMSDADLEKALASAKDGTYWKFGLTVLKERRAAERAGKDVPYFIYTDGGEHHEVIPTFTKDYAKEICGKPNTVMFSTLPESTNTSEGNPHARAPFPKQLNIHIDITEGTGTPEGNKAAYQTAQSLLLAAYDSGVRKFKLESMTPEEIKIWGDVRAALAGQGKSLEFTFADPSSQKVFDSHKAEFAKIEDLNKSIVKDKAAKVKASEKMEALPSGDGSPALPSGSSPATLPPGVRAAIGASSSSR